MSEYSEFGCEENFGIPEILISKLVSIFGELSLLTLSKFGWGGITGVIDLAFRSDSVDLISCRLLFMFSLNYISVVFFNLTSFFTALVHSLQHQKTPSADMYVNALVGIFVHVWCTWQQHLSHPIEFVVSSTVDEQCGHVRCEPLLVDFVLVMFRLQYLKLFNTYIKLFNWYHTAKIDFF